MKNNENIHDDNIQKSAPKLFSVNKENPFDVPENYFENLQSAISDKCTSTEKSKTDSARKTYQPYLSKK